MIFPIPEEEVILRDMANSMKDKLGVTDFSPGSVARTLLEVFNDRLSTAYKYLNSYAQVCFVSSAEGYYLDMIGYLLNCHRRQKENDENYRYRITNQVYAAAMGNETAIRMAILSVEGIKNAQIIPYTKGSGSFTVQIITDEIEPSLAILEAVKEKVNEVKSTGINAIVEYPKPTSIDFVFTIGMKNKNKDSQYLSNELKTAIQDYLDLFGTGSQISLGKIMSIVHDDDDVEVAFLTDLKVNNNSIIINTSLEFEWDERPYVKSVSVIVDQR